MFGFQLTDKNSKPNLENPQKRLFLEAFEELRNKGLISEEHEKFVYLRRAIPGDLILHRNSSNRLLAIEIDSEINFPSAHEIQDSSAIYVHRVPNSKLAR